MDRNREARRATNMAAPPNGLSSSRRRHRSSSLRDSPDEEGGMEVQEQGRLRDRGVVKKDRGDRDRDRDRDRERERSSRSKRRRENRMMIHHTTTGSNRDDGDETTSESVNEEEEDDDDGGAGAGAGLRMLHPSPANPSTSTHNNHNNINSSHTQQQLQHRKSFPTANKVLRAPPPAWKAAADEMIGVSVPRKARSASTKRSHDWVSGVVGVGGTGTADQHHRQSSASPGRPAAPPSPSSSNVSVRKKMKANGGGSKPRPPKSSSKSSSSNPEELEIEIAEVLYGLMTQSQAPSKKEIDSNKSSSDAKSRVSSPVSNSAALPQNSTSLSTVAPKRKRPRQVLENPVSSSVKSEIDHHQRHQSPKTDMSSPYLENNSPASAVAVVAADNGVSSFGFTTLPGHKAANSSPSLEPTVAGPQPPEERKCGVGAVLTKEEAEKESPLVKLNDGNSKVEAVITTAASTTVTNLKLATLETQSKKDEKIEIDLMAPPPQQRTSHGCDGDIDFSDHKQKASQETSKTREDDKLKKSDTDEPKASTIQETGESSKHAVNEEVIIQLNIDLEKPDKGSAGMVSGSSNRSLHQSLKHPQLSAKSETPTEKTAQSSSMPMPMSLPSWPPMGYVAPLQGVISMDGSTMASAPIQPIFTNPRPKRCATHCYIARNIHCYQQFMKMNPFWPAASGSAAPMFGAKPCNLNVMPSNELHANILQSMQDKSQAVGIFPGYTPGKDTKSSQPATITDPAQRKQQVMLQQAMPPVAPNNILHGPAFIFPFNQQQAVAASASVRPGSSKLTTSTAPGGLGAASGAANSATVNSSTTAAAPALSFNYPNISANDTQYLAILQNNPYTFPVPAVGAPPNYRPSPHAQAMPLFNGSFYSSQMIQPSQIPQPPPQATPPTQAQNHHPSQSQQTHQNSSGSTSSSQKHLQAQQRQQGSAAVNGGGSGNVGSLHNSYHAAVHKSRSQQSSQQQNQHGNPALQVRHLENEVTGREDSPSTADSRVSRAANTMSAYSHNFAMPVHSKAFSQMDNPNGALTKAAAAAAAAAATISTNSNDKHQQSQQQGLKRGGADSSLPPQTFAMSFAPMNGTTGNISMAQNHAIFQSLPESLRQGYHMMAAPTTAAHQSQQKDFRVSEETTRTGHDSSNADEDRKVSSGLTAKSGQSIAFSRPDLATDASGSNNRSSRSPISTSIGTATQSSHPLHAHFQQQQHVLQLQKQQQQNPNMNNARSKNPPSSNGNAYPEHLITSSSSMAAKFPNSISSFPLQTSNTSSSPVQSPQWRNSVRGATASQVPFSHASAATTSSLKNLHQSQQQSSRSHPQSHTQISFGATASQKLQPTTSVQMQQQQQNQNPSSNSGNQSPSPPMLVGSPTASISKGGGGGGSGGSPRTNASASTSGRTAQVSSLSSSQPAKNSPVGTQRSSPSILGNPNNSNSTKPQHLQKQTLHQQKVQAMMMYGQPYMQVQQQAQAQVQHHSASSMSPAQMMMYTHPIRLQQQQSSQQQSSSTAMHSLSPPVTHASTATSDPAKAIAAATSMMNHPQYGAAAAQSSMPAGFPQYVHNAAAAAAVQVKPVEQKQPAGNDNLRMSQPEKK